MEMNKVLIDTNVCLDAVQKRIPFAASSAKILSLSERDKINGHIAAHGFDTIFYILRKQNTIKASYKGIKGLRKTIEIAPVTKQIIDEAIHLNWDDFEDAIHYCAAVRSDCEAIVTQNEKDFKHSKLPVYSPLEFLDSIADE